MWLPVLWTHAAVASSMDTPYHTGAVVEGTRVTKTRVL